VSNIAHALARLNPANAADHEAGAAAYSRKLRALDAWMRGELTAVPASKRRVISSHDPLEYLAKDLRHHRISIHVWTNNSEPSAPELSPLVRQIEAEHVRSLFLDSTTTRHGARCKRDRQHLLRRCGLGARRGRLLHPHAARHREPQVGNAEKLMVPYPQWW
jgi:ABC-type Zn uptake system ZnuABC Zn-binding protein ZnuA